MWRLQGPTGLQVRLVGGRFVWGLGRISSLLLPSHAGSPRGCSTGGMFHSFQTATPTPQNLLPHCFPPLTQLHPVQPVRPSTTV
ncbi:hypothetical protein F5883DRAFT_534687 [Diaporthe sp. PMI_573]|nr:hypothetical protein F5883DRAFT_534687 [Diaporthaceae sp. PMI_573]